MGKLTMFALRFTVLLCIKGAQVDNQLFIEDIKSFIFQRLLIRNSQNFTKEEQDLLSMSQFKSVLLFLKLNIK